MSKNIQSLWPEQISKKTLSPRAILRAQAEALATQTGGILVADIKEKENEHEIIMLDFDVVVPVLGNYRHRLFRLAHQKDFPYPAMVDAEVFGSGGKHFFNRFLEYDAHPDAAKNFASGDQQLVMLIEQVLHSSQVVSATQSLLARASDAIDVEQPVPSIPLSEPQPSAE